MNPSTPSYRQSLDRAHAHAVAYLDSVASRHVGTRAARVRLLSALGGPVPDDGDEPAHVIDALASAADPGLVASMGSRFFGFVTGGSHPAAVGADWLVSAWDQNAALHVMSPAVSAIEDVTASWILDLLGLPASASVGFVTGAHTANQTALAAARHEVLRRAGWDVEAHGMQGAPRVHAIVGGDAHVSIFAAFRMIGIGHATIMRTDVDDQGRMRVDSLAACLARCDGPTIVCAQAGHVGTGAFDPLRSVAEAVHGHGAWLHVDGAFGLWASAVPSLRHLADGVELADSWTTDAHKWLNVPYDSGIVMCAHPAAHRAAMSQLASYLIRATGEERDGMDWVPEASRRARAVPIYALIRALGRRGIQQLVERCCALARRMASTLEREPGIRIMNDVVLNQVLVNCGPATPEVIRRVQQEGVCWAGGAEFRGQQVMRISVSSWRTTDEDIDTSAAAIVGAYRSVARVHS